MAGSLPKALRALGHDDHPELPIVIITMHGDEALRRDAVNAGAAGFLTKDVSMQEVVATITQAASGEVALSTELAATILHDPAQIQVARRNAPVEAVRQVVYPVDRHRKRDQRAAGDQRDEDRDHPGEGGADDRDER